jgi:single stranded DNA-binding protein
MGDCDGTDRKARGMNSWRAGCVETRTSGSEGGLRKRTGRKTGTAPQPDPYVWRDQAEHLADSLSKGDRVMVTGRLRQRSWETPEGERRSVAEIEADEVGASLRFATAKVERAQERGPSDRSQGRERQAERGGDFNDPPPF